MSKKVYIYESDVEVSTMYHSDGGLVIITDRDPQVCWNEFLDKTKINIENRKLPEPTISYTIIDDVEEKVYVFPDAGCC